MRSPEIMKTSVVLVQGATVFRSGATAAAHRNVELMQANAGVLARMKAHLPGGITQAAPLNHGPAITRVNGHSRGVIEPGGQYEIAGHAFGRQQGEVFARFAGTTIHLTIDHWSDETIFAGLDSALSGLPDCDSIEMYVGVKGSPAIKTTRFGFHAARETVGFAPPESSFSYDKGQPFTVLSQTIWSSRAPNQLKTDGEYLDVYRSSFHDDPHKACFATGFDSIRWNVPVKPGFEVVDFEWYHNALQTGDGSGIQHSHAGDYSATWDGDDIRVDYAVQRDRTPPFALLSGSVWCTSRYKIKLKAIGPRGMPPV